MHVQMVRQGGDEAAVGLFVHTQVIIPYTVKSCIKAAAYVHFFDFSGRLLYETGLCAAVVQLLAAYTVQSMYAGIQHPCVLYMTSHTINSIKSHFLQAAATIR